MRGAFVLAAGLTAAVSFRVGMEAGASAPHARATVGGSRATRAAVGHPTSDGATRRVRPARRASGAGRDAGLSRLNEVIDTYCIDCHSDGMLLGNLSIEGYDIARADTARAKSEKMIRKLRAEMMPPPGLARPAGDTLLGWSRRSSDSSIAAAPVNPGSRTFQRLNRAEYERAVRDLLGVTRRRGRRTCRSTPRAPTSTTSPTGSCCRRRCSRRTSTPRRRSAASRWATRTAPATQTTLSRLAVRVAAPVGSRARARRTARAAASSPTHTFLADGYYEFRLNVGGGIGTPLEDLDVSIDGERVALLKYEKGIA